MRVIAPLLTLLMTGGTTTPQGWLARPTAGQAALFAVLELAGLALVALVGAVWLWALARSAHRAPQAQPPSPTYGSGSGGGAQ